MCKANDLDAVTQSITLVGLATMQKTEPSQHCGATAAKYSISAMTLLRNATNDGECGAPAIARRAEEKRQENKIKTRRELFSRMGANVRVGSTLMSKGHGMIQRHVLRELAEAAANTHSRDWVAVVEMGWSSRAKKQAVRRAMKRLAEEGYVELFYRPLHEYGERVRTHLCGRITDKGLHALARAYAELGSG